MSKLFKKFSWFGFLVLGVASVCVTGCSSDDFSLAPVSGIVIADGKPVVGVDVSFYPQPTDDNPTPGPFSSGKTDEQGRFTLVLRDGREGAVVGANRVGFQLPGASRSALDTAQQSLKEVSGDPKMYAEDIKLLKQRVASIKQKIAQFSSVDPKYLESRALNITVPSDGLTELEIDVSKK